MDFRIRLFDLRNMIPHPGNFTNTRLDMKTPFKGSYCPKLIHGIVEALLSGLQTIDAILGEVICGRACPQ